MDTLPKFKIDHVLAKFSGLASEVLERQTDLNPSDFSRLLEGGGIWLNGQRLKHDLMVAPGAYLRVHRNPRRYVTQGIDWKATVFHEDVDFLVINKPAGVPVHATVDNAIENVLAQLQAVLGHEVYVTQRLDTVTYGLFVVAKTKWFQSKFNQRLADRAIQKTYLALSEHPVPQGLHRHFMEDSFGAPKILHIEEAANRALCELEVLECVETPHGYRSKIRLLTGRTHQIRAQLAKLGCPIRGDLMYGGSPLDPWNCRVDSRESIALCSYRLEFQHPAKTGDAARCLFLLSQDPGGTVIA